MTTLVIAIGFLACREENTQTGLVEAKDKTEEIWPGRRKEDIPPQDSLVIYGRELIEQTAYYLGPKGKVASITNGMNCQNCHLAGGTLPWGNNYGGVSATYPRYRDRSGGLETIPKRINDCIQRSLNGQPIDSNSREMRAIIAYMHWLGEGLPKGVAPSGSGIMKLKYPDRPADTTKGLVVYQSTCQTCHGTEGQGLPNAARTGYVYPPLWGKHSYTTGAGLFRLSRFAGLVRNTMPFGQAYYHRPALSDEQAWDVAAYVNSRPRPGFDISADWPDISTKPIDHPFGPYTDGFSEQQHKYGPFGPIEKTRKTQKRR